MQSSTTDSVLGRDRLAVMQGAYFVATGIWPLVHLPSFEAVTGPKVDKWLVKMVGLLAASIGASLLAASRRPTVSREAAVLGASSAVAFAAIDVWYALRGRISPIYLADAAVETGLAVAWLARGATPSASPIDGSARR